MADIIIVDVPVRPHVKAYIENNFFLKHGQTWKHTDPLWPVFSDYLQGKRTSYTFARKKNAAYISVSLSCHKGTNYRNIIADDKAVKFNDLVERLMMYEFCKRAVLLKKHTRLKTKDIILDFLIEYCFEDHHLSYERLKKALSRYELKLKNKQSRKVAA